MIGQTRAKVTHHFLSFASQLLSNLYPSLIEPLLDSGDVGVCLRVVCPSPTIMMYIGDRI
jgi:hypothetical protein